METNIIKSFNLPSYIKGKTFAEASKLIENKFKDKKDKASLETKGEFMSRLAEAQEYIKMKDNVSNGNQPVDEFMFGGEMSDDPASYLNAAGTFANLGSKLFGNADVDVSGSEFVEKENVASGTLSSAMQGAGALGSVLPGLGHVIGAVGGGITGFVGAKKQNKAASTAQNNFYLANSADNRSDFKYGGSVNKYNNGGDLDNIFKPQGSLFDTQVSTFAPTTITTPKTAQERPVVSNLNKAVNWLGQNYGNIASMAPLVGSLTNKVRLEPTAKGSRVRNTYNRTLFDEQSAINSINQNNVNRSLIESSGGDLGALRTNMLAANLNKDKAISQALNQGQNINREENKFAYQTGLNRDMFNAQLDDRHIDRVAQDKAAFNTAKSELRSNLYEDIGALGKEIVDKKLVRDMFGYKWDGKYFVDKTGKKYSQKEMAKQVADKKKETE
jgi:hypothetical protein